MLLLCSLCLEYSSRRHLHGSLPRPPSGVSLNECFIWLFFENSRVRYFLIHADHLSWHVPFLFPDILYCSHGASRVYLLVQVQVIAKLAVVLLLLIFAIFSLAFLWSHTCYLHVFVFSCRHVLLQNFHLEKRWRYFMTWLPKHLLNTYFLPCIVCSPPPTEENLELGEVTALPRAT